MVACASIKVEQSCDNVLLEGALSVLDGSVYQMDTASCSPLNQYEHLMKR